MTRVPKLVHRLSCSKAYLLPEIALSFSFFARSVFFTTLLNYLSSLEDYIYLWRKKKEWKIVPWWDIDGRYRHALNDARFWGYFCIRHAPSRLSFLFCHCFCGRSYLKYEAVYPEKQECSTYYPGIPLPWISLLVIYSISREELWTESYIKHGLWSIFAAVMLLVYFVPGEIQIQLCSILSSKNTSAALSRASSPKITHTVLRPQKPIWTSLHNISFLYFSSIGQPYSHSTHSLLALSCRIHTP